jgi:hypothetical protein
LMRISFRKRKWLRKGRKKNERTVINKSYLFVYILFMNIS